MQRAIFKGIHAIDPVQNGMIVSILTKDGPVDLRFSLADLVRLGDGAAAVIQAEGLTPADVFGEGCA